LCTRISPEKPPGTPGRPVELSYTLIKHTSGTIIMSVLAVSGNAAFPAVDGFVLPSGDEVLKVNSGGKVAHK
jgi:hypothetical protein